MKALRVLQVVGGMNHGGTETWLMHVLRRTDRRDIQMDFLVHGPSPGVYADEVGQLGSRMVLCGYHRHPLQYARRFSNILHTYGPYDIVHGHMHFFNGYVLWLARRAGVVARLAHVHSLLSDEKASFGRRIYVPVMKRLVIHSATMGLACSESAGATYFANTWGKDRRWRVLPCGIDVNAFSGVTVGDIRSELGLPADSLVIGHVGRLELVKNHECVLGVAKRAMERNRRIHLLLVGDGSRRAHIEALARSLGIAGRVVIAGTRMDVPRIMVGAMDCLLLPSFYEGLPLTLLEAQAAALPAVVSDVVSDEADVIPSMIRRLSLAAPLDSWVDAIEECFASRQRRDNYSAIDEMRRSQFSVNKSVEGLSHVYHSAIDGSAPRKA